MISNTDIIEAWTATSGRSKQSLRNAPIFGKQELNRRDRMNYKGYEGVVEYDDEAKVFHGEVTNMRDVVTFQGKSVQELERAFRESVEDYLAFCKSRNEKPEKPFSGNVLLRMPPALHRRIALEARRKGKSVNRYIVDRLKPKPSRTG
jgi:predicted HicB family RNase H-like nuclease